MKASQKKKAHHDSIASVGREIKLQSPNWREEERNLEKEEKNLKFETVVPVT